MNLRRCFLAVLLVVTGWVGSASAALLPPVTVNGLEWLQPIDFINRSWNDINTVCDATTGLCNGSLLGNDLTGWTWAGFEDMNTLFNFFIGTAEMGPGYDSYLQVGGTWATAALNIFSPTWNANNQVRVTGLTKDREVSNPSRALLGRVMLDSVNPNNVFDLANTNITNATTVGSPDSGAWFFRTASVEPPPAAASSPATLPLLGLGIVALGYCRRKHGLQSLSI